MFECLIRHLMTEAQIGEVYGRLLNEDSVELRLLNSRRMTIEMPDSAPNLNPHEAEILSRRLGYTVKLIESGQAMVIDKE